MTNGEYENNKAVEFFKNKLDRLEADKRKCVEQIEELVQSIKIIDTLKREYSEAFEHFKNRS